MKRCAYCSRPFEPRHHRQIYHDQWCAMAANKSKQPTYAARFKERNPDANREYHRRWREKRKNG